VRAQVDLTGGGDRHRGRAVTPLEAADRTVFGAEAEARRRRVETFVEQQRRLLAGAAESRSVRVPDADPAKAQGALPGAADEDLDRALSQLRAQLDRRAVEGDQGPRRRTYGVDAVGVSYARYVDEWATRIERLGTEHYPDAARGRAYDAMLVTVEIDREGNVVDIVLHNRSRHEVLNRAVRRIVLAGAPYRKFTPEMAREGDILQIVRVWNFTNDALATRSAGAP
jgi:protein TonB